MELSEREQAVKALEGLEAKLASQLEMLQQSDPFYFYTPSDGVISQESRAFLEKFLKPEDIPQRCDSQLDAHLCDADTILNAGGNQGGKTTWLIIEALIHATGELPLALESTYPKTKLPQEPMRYIRLEGESDQQLDDVLVPAMRYWVPKKFLLGGWEEAFSAKAKTLTLTKDGQKVATVQFNSFTQDVSKLQGKKLTFVGYDEEPPKSHREENLFRFTTAKRLQERYSMTPTKGMGWVKDEIVDKQGPKVKAFKMASVVNKHANLDVLQTIVEKMDSYESKKMRLLGEFVSLSGLIYGGLLSKQVHVIESFNVGCDCLVKEGHTQTHQPKCSWHKYMIVRGMDVHTVTPPAMVECAIDREGNMIVVGSYNPKSCPDVQDVKKDVSERAKNRGYRVAWSIVDKSTDSDIKVLGNLNIYKKLISEPNPIRPLFKSEKYTGSIMTGVDEIKDMLKVNPVTKKPRLFFFNTPEAMAVYHNLESLERDQYNDEDTKGPKDQILEGRKHLHAAFRYITQRRINFIEAEEVMPYEGEPAEEAFI